MSVGALLGAFAAAVVAVVLAELADVGAWFAPKIVRSASKKMPTPELRERYREEWLAELSAFDGLKLIKLSKALSLWANSCALPECSVTSKDLLAFACILRNCAPQLLGPQSQRGTACACLLLT